MNSSSSTSTADTLTQSPKAETELRPQLLDSPADIAKIDQSNVLGSIEAYPDQFRQAWAEVKQLDLSAIENQQFTHLVVAGMGGSGLGADIVKHWLADQLPISFEIINDYHFPAYVDEHTLLILSSYSGETEETLAAAKQALAQQLTPLVITTGGQLATIARQANWPAYIFQPQHNHCHQPRLAIGYAVVSLLALFSRLKLINFTDTDLEEAIITTIRTFSTYGVEVPVAENKAKNLAFSLVDRRPVLVGAEFLAGAVHTFTNQLNENAKVLASYNLIPELNHHLLEGLTYPKSNHHDQLFLLFASDLYQPRNQKRLELTNQIIDGQAIETIQIKLEEETKLTQVFELITLGSLASFYLALLNGLDPSQIPVVSGFKKQLDQAKTANPE